MAALGLTLLVSLLTDDGSKTSEWWSGAAIAFTLGAGGTWYAVRSWFTGVFADADRLVIKEVARPDRTFLRSTVDTCEPRPARWFIGRARSDLTVHAEDRQHKVVLYGSNDDPDEARAIAEAISRWATDHQPEMGNE